MSNNNRYHRQGMLSEVGSAGQEKLKSSKVLVVGAGGLGCPALSYLAGAGVGNIGIIDGDIVDESNLHRQTLFSTPDVGKNKAIQAAEKLALLNSEVNLDVIPSYLDVSIAKGLFQKYEIVVDSTDNFGAKYLINDTTAHLGIPCVYGSVFQFQGHVSLFNYIGINNLSGPSLRCLYPEPPTSGLLPSCVEGGVIGPVTGVIGSLQALEVLKVLLNFGELLVGKLLAYDFLENSFNKIAFSRSSQISREIHSEDTYRAMGAACSVSTEEISLDGLLNLENYVLVDLGEHFGRTSISSYGIEGEHIAYSELSAELLLKMNDKKIVLYCQNGLRSRIVASQLRNRGFSNIVSLEGGLSKWRSFAMGL